MPYKIGPYSGGYKIIDLQGVTISNSGEVVDGLFDEIDLSDKPVLLTNFIVDIDSEPFMPCPWGAQITGRLSDNTGYYALLMADGSQSVSIYIEEDSSILLSHQTE